MLIISNSVTVDLKLTELQGNLRYLWSPMSGDVGVCVICLPLGSLPLRFWEVLGHFQHKPLNFVMKNEANLGSIIIKVFSNPNDSMVLLFHVLFPLSTTPSILPAPLSLLCPQSRGKGKQEPFSGFSLFPALFCVAPSSPST